MELTPVGSGGRQVIERYGASGFRVSGIVYPGPVLVFPETTAVWEGAAATIESLAPVIAHGGVEILLLGLGARMTVFPAALRQSLRASRIALEAMDTGAACRTFNLLIGENRRVAAALVPPICLHVLARLLHVNWAA
jgi:uncharacterized protein